MRIDVLTLFPEVCEPYFGSSILGRAQKAGLVKIVCTNFRDFTTDKHRSVDDTTFGGGPGMLLAAPPVFAAVDHLESVDPTPALRILLSPQGEPLTHSVVEDLADQRRLLIIAGHYEGFDERIRLGLSPREISIGDYVLSGGEAAAMVLVDAVVRLQPGVLGHQDGAADESFADGLLEYPQYTRPRVFRGMTVPEVLLSGDHGRIAAWRDQQRIERTHERRPDLVEGLARLDGEETT